MQNWRSIADYEWFEGLSVVLGDMLREWSMTREPATIRRNVSVGIWSWVEFCNV